MKKSIFGLVLITMLVGIFIVNVFQEVRKNKENARELEENITQIASVEGSIAPNSEGLSEGDAPPDFELKTLEGKTIRLSDYKGKKVILNFWASWCPPCKAEMPHMETYYKTNAKKQNIEIIAVNLTNLERGSNKLEQVKNFVKDYRLTFQIPLDENGDVGRTYQTLSIPTSYMIDSNGLINKKIIGPMDGEMIEKLVKEMD
ncbi:redoxin domain-containing protein (plasmid) [Cytobacillus firmus]|uniref:redoxin domain-containing protein n=1 Tax=Bacillaceae TaxID=186817 RepID=UPI001A8EF879|nr:redoxin domain-containing protein [Bacillus sp. NTK034]MBN8202780.1 redoxin domain-containing protein [Bacillus sp. NTK034]